jgi:hypothetical protein
MGHADDFLSATNDRIFASNKNTGWHFVTSLFGAIRLANGHSSNTALDNLARNEKMRLPFMTGFWRQQQKPAPMSGLIFTPEWLRDSKSRWAKIREKKRIKIAKKMEAANPQLELEKPRERLDAGDVSMSDGEEEGKQQQEQQQEEQEEEQEEEEERKSCRTTTGWWISS